MMRDRQSALALILLVPMLLAACTDEVDRPEVSCDRPSSGAVLCVFATEDGPTGRLLTQDDDVSGALGSFCWTFDDLGRCEDFDEIPELGRAVNLERGAVVTLVDDAERVSASVAVLHLEDGTRHLSPVTDLDFRSGTTTLGVRPGKYVVALFGRWEQGDGELYFPVEVI
jgi:hypothetical protein